MNTTKITILTAALTATAAAFGAIRATSHDNYGGSSNAWQLKRHAEKMKEVAAGGAKIVFVGDSITHFWETNGRDQLKKYFSEGDMKMLDLGTSADRTEHVLWRLNEGGELDGYEAKCVLLMIGTNNAGHFPFDAEPPSDAILGVREIVKTIRAKQPKAKLVIQAIFPRGKDSSDAVRRRNDVVNREIMKFADGKDIFWCDFSDDYLTAAGTLPKELFPDLLHPAAHGYDIWYDAVKPYIDYALADGRLPAPKNRCAKDRSELAKAPSTVRPATRIRSEGYGKRDWWLDRLAQKRNEIADSKGAFDLVFFGDSITHNWENQGKDMLAELKKTYSVLDIGYSGDRTEHLVWRGLNGELSGYKAKCIMLMIGTNNGKDSAADVAKGVKRVLEVIAEKQPQAVTLLLPIFPRGDAKDKSRAKNEKVNAIIKDYADGKKVVWVDFNAQFLDKQGDTKWIMPDRLHPNADGYRNIWLPAVRPYFEKLTGKKQ